MKLEYLCLGKDQKKNKNGSFRGGGNWILLKCFHPAGEFYFNFNSEGKAEIIRKDKCYGEGLIEALKKELL